MSLFQKKIDRGYLRIASLLALAALTISCGSDNAARQQQASSQVSVVKETRADVDNLQHEVNSNKSQLQILEDRLNQQETALTALRQQQADGAQASQDSLKQKWPALEKRLSALEKTQESTAGDLKQLKTHANETTTSLAQFKAKQSDLEQRLDKNVSSLKTAMESLMEMAQPKSSGKRASKEPSEKSSTAYKVKSGDSLERIARSNQTTVERLKELNQLKSDVIFVGQQLALPTDNDG